MIKNLYLVGFMGVGKSTIARALRRRIGWELVDIDSMIVREQGMPVAQIFAERGEEEFRRIESETLARISEGRHQIISCGGGVPMRQENIRIMKENGICILLTASPYVILKRVEKDTSRPLLQGKKTIKGISGLMRERMPYYERACDERVSVNRRTVRMVVDEIVRRMTKRGYVQEQNREQSREKTEIREPGGGRRKDRIRGAGAQDLKQGQGRGSGESRATGDRTQKRPKTDQRLRAERKSKNGERKGD